ncbi:glutamine synthetase family protein [Nocardioides limicola]|uniref:glutamine synthetase family protein n=1 Tax=Nocardioides limicola TaxID=2803368 RepID=UPI00193BC146|nr:glutamine synthetase family protein [Nocardioides sp. DJM-14]
MPAAQFTGLAAHPDLHARLDLGTARIPPWEPDALWVLSALSEHGDRSALCPRNQLAEASDALMANTGFRAVAAGEPEFYLFRDDGDGPRPYSSDGVSYTIDRYADPDGTVGRMHRMLIDLGIGVTVVNREFSPGQFEINLGHGDVLDAADDAFLLKSSVKELAARAGLRATFMAKPQSDLAGSGFHVHVSLWDDDRNVFADGRDKLSVVGLRAVAGLQTHAPALMALGAPTVNSYRRVHGEALSPRRSNWGHDDRNTFVRVPPELGDSTRLELRLGDASASPHLVMAAMLHAIRDGIDRELEPTAEGASLPSSLDEAIDALAKDEVFVEGFGSEFIEVYSALKAREVHAGRVQVASWEWDLYAQHA